MHAGPDLMRSPVAFVPPDAEERRGDACLMVWGDLPHWSVVDAELRGVLARLDGCTAPRDLLAGRPDAAAAGKALAAALARLVERGLVRNGVAPRPRAEEPPRIENVAVNVTRRCNLRCRFCYALGHLTTDAAGEVDAAELARLLDAARPFLGRSPSLTLLGGEPLLEADRTLAMAGEASARGFVSIVSTNGTTVTPALAARARRAGLQVQVSLDGAEAAVHDAIRGPGAFARAVAGARALADAGAYTILSAVCHAGSLGDLERFYDLAVTLGAREARFIPLRRIGGAPASGLVPPALPDLVRAAAALFRRRPDLRRLTGRDAFSILYTTCRYSLRKRSCGTGLQTFLLDATGDLFPCLNTCVPALRVGNIREPGFDFARLWDASPVLRAVRRETSVEEPGNRCRDCVVRHWCLGGCRGETLQVRGALAERAPDCDGQKRAMLDLFWELAEGTGLVRTAEADGHF